MDEKFIALATQLGKDRKRARRIGVILGFSAIASPFAFFGLMPLGGLGAELSPWANAVLYLMYSVIFLSPVFIGAGFALMNVGLALKRRELWLKDQAKLESPTTTTEFKVRRRRDAAIMFWVSGGIVVIEVAFYVVAKIIEEAWRHPGPYGLSLGWSYFAWVSTFDMITAPILLGAASVLLLAGIAVIRRNRAIVLPEENTNGETNDR